jgi:hypothetical protein
MNDNTAQIGYGKIYNTLEGVMGQYDDIDDFLDKLDSGYFRAESEQEDSTSDDRDQIAIS